MERKRIRYFQIYAGATQEGKSYDIEKNAEQYKGVVFVYNAGKSEDFANYVQIEVLDLQDCKEANKRHLQNFYGKLILESKTKERKNFYEQKMKQEISFFAQNPKSVYFRHENKTYHFQDFLAFAVKNGSKIKAHRVSRESELKFFKTIFYYFSNVLLILDDTKSMFVSGLHSDGTNLFSKINHCGEKLQNALKSKGIDVQLVFHGLDFVNPEFFTYATDIILFKSVLEPQYNKADLHLYKPYLQKAFKTVNESPRYTKAVIQLRSLDYTERNHKINIKLIKPKL